MKGTMANKEKRKSRKRYFIIYTIAWAVISILAFSFFYANGKTFVYYTDGLRQHFTSLAYYGHYLREIVRTLFTQHTLEIPMIDFDIAMGADVFTTLHYYVIGDPLNLLSAAVPMKYTEYLFEFLVLLRIYLAGVSFSAYAFYHKNKELPTLFGCLIYVFSGWVLFASVRHPYFTNPMIYFPLIILGIDKIFKKEKPHLLIGMTALAGISNFYFFYMICILMVIYAAYRYFMIFKKRSVRDVFRWLGRFVGYFAIGFAISCVFMLPVIMLMLGTGRFQADTYLPAVYSRKYLDMFLSSLVGKVMSHFTPIGVSAVAMLGIMVLFLKRKKETALKIAYLMMLAFLLIPYVGHVFNGFSYVTNRWSWAFLLLSAYMFVKGYPELFTLTVKERMKLYALVLLYCALAMLGESGRILQNMGGLLILALSCGLLLWAYRSGDKAKWINRILAVGLVGGIVLNAYGQYMDGSSAYIDLFIDDGDVMDSMDTPSARAMKKIAGEDTGFYRYDTAGAGDVYNSSMLSRVPGINFFFSLSSPVITQFQRELYLNTPFEQSLNGLDGRTVLDRLFSVKYFSVTEGAKGLLPSGYDQYAASGKNDGVKVDVYRNDQALPLGYTYDTYLPRSEYEKLDVLEKQQALLQCAVVEDSSLKKGSPEFTHREAAYTVTGAENCRIEEGQVVAENNNAQLTIHCSPMEKAETYVIIEGLEYEDIPTKEQEQQKYWGPASKVNITASGGGCEQKLMYVTREFNFYCDRHDFILNLGSHEQGISEITLKFNKKGMYSFDKLTVAGQPMAGIDSYTADRRGAVLENTKVSANRVSGRINLDSPQMLLFSIPYSKGWTAYVDGEPARVEPANTMFMGLELEPGEHQVVLKYRTPWILPGLCISILGIVAWVALAYWRRAAEARRGRQQRYLRKSEENRG